MLLHQTTLTRATTVRRLNGNKADLTGGGIQMGTRVNAIPQITFNPENKA